MCIQVVELYSSCKCLYYKHALDCCPGYGQRGHYIEERAVLVGYSCIDHTYEGSSEGASSCEDGVSSCDTASLGDLAPTSSAFDPPQKFAVDLDHIIAVLLQDEFLVESCCTLLKTQGKKLAQRTTASLLEQFVGDLATEASSLREKQACRLLRRKRYFVANKIIDRMNETKLPQRSNHVSLDYDEDHLDDVAPSSSSSESCDKDFDAITKTEIEEMELFVLFSNAFELFKANLINHITRKPANRGLVFRVSLYAKSLFRRTLGEPKVASGSSRVRWTCV